MANNRTKEIIMLMIVTAAVAVLFHLVIKPKQHEELNREQTKITLDNGQIIVILRSADEIETFLAENANVNIVSISGSGYPVIVYTTTKEQK